MEHLSPGLIAELACAAGSWEGFEREVTPLLLHGLGGDTAFFADAQGISSHACGVVLEVRDEVQPLWAELAVGAEPLLTLAAQRGGSVVDREVLGRQLERLPYYELMMQPVRGAATLIGVLTRGGAVVQKIALGRCRGSTAFDDGHRALLNALLPTLSLAHAALQARSAAAETFERGELRALIETLTPREREVLDYLRLGYTNAEIGAALGTRPRTVRNQLSRVYEKLGVANRSEAVGLSLGLQQRA